MVSGKYDRRYTIHNRHSTSQKNRKEKKKKYCSNVSTDVHSGSKSTTYTEVDGWFQILKGQSEMQVFLRVPCHSLSRVAGSRVCLHQPSIDLSSKRAQEVEDAGLNLPKRIASTLQWK